MPPEEILRRWLQGPGLQMRGDGNQNKGCVCAGVGRMKITGFRNYMGRTQGLWWFSIYIHTYLHTYIHTHTHTKKSLRWLLYLRKSKLGENNSNLILHMLHLGCSRVFWEEMSKRQLGMQVWCSRKRSGLGSEMEEPAASRWQLMSQEWKKLLKRGHHVLLHELCTAQLPRHQLPQVTAVLYR